MNSPNDPRPIQTNNNQITTTAIIAAQSKPMKLQLLAIFLGFAAANTLMALIFEYDLSIAAERTFFQSVALFAVYLTQPKKQNQ